MQIRELDSFGRVRLSRHFFMRDFLYSEVAAKHGINNVPDDPDLAIATGKRLCTEVLEPIVSMFGPIAIRSGFRSAKLNEFASAHRLQCASNEKNFAYHIWDHRDVQGHSGAAACIVVPWVIDNLQQSRLDDFALFLHERLNYHRMVFFRSHATLNIGWHEAPRREILSYWPKPRTVLRVGQAAQGSLSLEPNHMAPETYQRPAGDLLFRS
ncbi:hypothetical protein [Devosia naphthalenivorans]|uniref:hypothetical protein n=1 Tax=Devosia naphthalenivorans TaxID=2082392 RepID=UPI000D34C3AF|nr:hypothetical protein [Devosia naphthalenivorans]